MISTALAIYERADIDALYTPLAQALEELRRRREDCALVERVRKYHEALPLTFISNDPAIFFFRPIISPTHELDRFLCTIKKTGLLPLLIEYKQDAYVSCNRDKYRLCRLSFSDGNAEPKGLRAVDMASLEQNSPALKDLKTKNGLPLADFHHALVQEQYPGLENHIVDFSEWFSKATKEEFFYFRYLSLFLCHGILVENFVFAEAGELQFIRQRVIPSFEKVVEIFGIRPLIVPLLPFDTEGSDFWRALPLSLYGKARELLSTLYHNGH